MARAFYRRSGYVRPSSTHADLQRRASSSGAATAAVIVPIALIAAGFLAWKRSQRVVAIPAHAANALPGMSGMDGMGGFKKKFKKAAKQATNVFEKISPTAQIAKQAKKIVADPKGMLKKLDPVNVLAKSPIFSKTRLIRKLRPKGQQQDTSIQPEPDQPIVYQDITGASITEAEYNALLSAQSSDTPIQVGNMWAMPAGYLITAAQYAEKFPGASNTGGGGYQSPGIMPPSHGARDGTSYTTIYSPEGQAPNDPAPGGGGGGGGSGFKFDTGTAFINPVPTQQYAPAASDMATPAAKRFNPLIAIGALIAVPVVMGLTGGK